jgi:hypothetical protein
VSNRGLVVPVDGRRMISTVVGIGLLPSLLVWGWGPLSRSRNHDGDTGRGAAPPGSGLSSVQRNAE